MKNICFTGHRIVRDMEKAQQDLSDIIERLIRNGAVNFYAGGATGFDTLAADAVILLRQKYPHIRLHLVLPCCESEQTLRWSDTQKVKYRAILSAADGIEYISEHYYDGCMRKRNARLIELADCCVCYYNDKNSASGTGQTVRMALKKSIPVVNLFSAKTI